MQNLKIMLDFTCKSTIFAKDRVSYPFISKFINNSEWKRNHDFWQNSHFDKQGDGQGEWFQKDY